jgi:hypothetical protein
MPIVCDDGLDEAWCDQKYCGGKLIPWKNESMVCSLCEHLYSPDSIKKHKAKLGPNKDPYGRDGPLLVSMTEYSEKPKKKPSILDKEDKLWVSQGSGRSIIDYDEYYPEGQDNTKS